MDEIWKGIEGLNYSVSNIGNIKNSKTNRILKVYQVEGGSFRIKLVKGKVRKNYKVHRLVAEAFIPNPDNKPEVDHKDRNNQNNKVSNLRWATRIENCENRLMISEDIIKQIIKLSGEGISVKKIYNKIKNIE